MNFIPMDMINAKMTFLFLISLLGKLIYETFSLQCSLVSYPGHWGGGYSSAEQGDLAGISEA